MGSVLFCELLVVFFRRLTMETLRGLLALLCVFLAGAQTTTQINKFAGKFAEICSKTNATVTYDHGFFLHVNISLCLNATCHTE